MVSEIYFIYLQKLNDEIMSRTVFNAAQLELLSIMASVKDDA